MAALYTTAQAHIVASGLNATDLDGWTYAVEDNGNGTAYISVSDDDGEFVDYLDIRFVAELQLIQPEEPTTQEVAFRRMAATTRITALRNGVVITRH